jgi:hypothetical protein
MYGGADYLRNRERVVATIIHFTLPQKGAFPAERFITFLLQNDDKRDLSERPT